MTILCAKCNSYVDIPDTEEQAAIQIIELGGAVLCMECRQ